MTVTPCEQSAEIAANIGAFPDTTTPVCHVSAPLAKDNVASMLGVIQQHRAAVGKISRAGNSIFEG